MSWIDYFDDNLSVKSVYKGQVPSLDNIQLKEIQFEHDGPKITLVINLLDFPSEPPKKWIQNEYNRVQIRLVLFDVIAVSASGWTNNNVGSVTISECNNAFDVEFTSPRVRLFVTCNHPRIGLVSAHRTEDPDKFV